MADWESLRSKLANILDELNLNIGNRNEIQNELSKLNHILLILNEIEEEIDSELGFEKMKNAAMGALPFLGAVASFFIPGGVIVDAVISGSAGLLAEKFGNNENEVSLSDLQERIYGWINWLNQIQEIGEYILNDSGILNQINNYLRWENINNEIHKNVDLIKINLSLNNADLLRQQLNQISHSQDDVVKLQKRLNDAYDKLQNSDDIYEIIIGLSNYYGNCGFSLEWLDDEHGLIISSAGEFLSLSEIINNCEYFKQEIGDLILNANHLKSQAEEALYRLKNNQSKKHKDNKRQSQHYQTLQTEVINNSQKIFIFKPSLIIGIVSIIFIFLGIYIGKDKLPQIQQITLNSNQEEKAKNDFESAQKLGIEASIIVKNPPHPQEVWEKSYIKWQEAISLLGKIPEGTSISEKAKKQISSYRVNSQAISTRILNEKKAKENFELSQKLAIESAILVQNPPHPPKVWKQAQLKWKQAIKLLESIPNGTFFSKKAKEKLSSYRTNYAAVSTQVKN
ncbi:hypothetical protein IQ231_11940 [Cuspidothrix issatschenkoi LEGE 03284]|uniref:hypothetical protein n=1 Tax=Cuspidothrix issatschenkoi TaxID=230752 RepID=UPI0018800849|nr:hypothetical protein [Cuspidothrix issatschenkoi]MBE9232369.1 hypothetical protein [Cuspidothrix issatschenkoi LEGE 03284]